MNGNGTPVIGNNPIVIPTFSIKWNKNMPAIPIALHEPVLLVAVFAIFIAFVINTIYTITIARQVIKRNSSRITEKIKSVVLGYKKPNCVCVPCPPT